MTTTLTASHKLVAWAWLDSLVDKVERTLQREERIPGGAKTVPADLPPVMSMTPRTREQAVKDSYETFKRSFVRAVGDVIPEIRRKQSQIAQQHDLDPLFFDWFLMAGRHWPPMPTKTTRALRAIQGIFTWYGEVPNSWNNMTVPELEQGRDRDQAMKELGEWFVRTIVPKLERTFAKLSFKESNDLVQRFKGRSAPRDPHASLLLLRDFKKRLFADRYPERAAIQAVVNLFS